MFYTMWIQLSIVLIVSGYTIGQDLLTTDFLIYAGSSSLVQVGINGTDSQVIDLPVTFSNLVALDYVPQTNMVYFTDVALKGVYKFDLHNTSTFQTIRQFNSSSVLDGITFDVRANVLYLTDDGDKVIFRMGEDGTDLEYFMLGVEHPRAIVLEYKSRYVYWTDWSATNPRIERARMSDSSGREILISGNLVWPNGLTLDVSEDKMYWCDASTDVIEMSDLLGGSRTTLNTYSNRHFFGIVKLYDVLFVSDWVGPTIHKINITTGDILSSYGAIGRPDGIDGLSSEDDVNYCLLDPCDNNATCMDAVNDYSCICVDGFTGQNCEKDIDECMSDPCDNNATCVDAINNYTCVCVDGFTGGNCETDIDDCVTDPCENNATCVDAIDNFSCNCINGFTGRNCETDIIECKSQPCQNGATCNDDINSYNCLCKEGWSGTHCEVDVDECLNGPCSNGGSCQNTPGSFKCTCAVKWAGTTCKIKLNEDPVVNSASPNKGPVAGGTRTTVRGKHLPAGDPISVHIGTLDCVTTHQSETTVIAVTLPVNESDTSLVGIDLPMSVEISGGKVFKLTDTFLYKGNPKIESFRPRGTIVNGGTQITVSGEDLDAVAAPAVKIIVTYYKAISKDPIEYNVTTTNYEGPCEVKGVSEMRCETPEIELPEDFKIDKEPDTNSDGESRRKRSDDNIEYQDGDDRLTFYVGFALDGVKDFENFSSINVHPEPIFNFDYGDGNNVFQYKQGERLRFAGDSLDAGIMASDYRIDIGKAMCGSLELLSNSLSCKPPGEKPQLVSSNPEPNPKIIINVGLNVQHFAGYLEYPDTEQLYIVIPASILSVIVIITIILTVCLLRRNRKRGKESINKVKSFSVFEGHDDYPHYHAHHTSRYGREPTNRIIPRRSTIHPIFSDPYYMVVTNNRQHKDHVHPKGLLGDDSFQDGNCVRSKGLPRQEIVENTASVDKYSRNQRLRQPMFNNTRSATQYIRGQGLERQAGRDLNANAQGLPRTDTMLREAHNVVQQSLDTNNALTRNHDIAEHHRHTNQNNRRGVVINENVVAYQDIGLNNFVPSPPPPPPPPPPAPPAPPAPLMRRDTEFQSQLPNSPNDDRKEHNKRIIRWLSDDDFQN